MPTAMSGCVIVEDKGNVFVYREKCEKCGFLSRSTLTGALPANTSKRLHFVCPKCRAKNTLIIRA